MGSYTDAEKTQYCLSEAQKMLRLNWSYELRRVIIAEVAEREMADHGRCGLRAHLFEPEVRTALDSLLAKASSSSTGRTS